MSTGAPALSLSIDGRDFQCTGEGTAQPVQGGYTSEHQANGDPSTGRFVLTPKGWSFPDQTIEVNMEQNDVQYIEEKISSASDLDIVFTYIGFLINATGRVEGDFQFDPATATGTISFKGSGKYKIKNL